MNVLKKYINYLFCIFCFVYGQEKDFSYNLQISLGASFSISSFASNLPINNKLYNYMPLVFGANFYLPILKKAKHNQLVFYVEPNIVAVILKQADYGLPGLAAAINWDDNNVYNQLKKHKSDWEIGFHTGFLHQILLLESWLFFYGLGCGPHYFPIQNDNRQSPGFIFASHVLFGTKFRLQIKAQKQIEFSALIRYRHLSNGQIYKHNQGLDNIMLGFGLAYLFPWKK